MVDSHSTDRTPEIARSFGAALVDFTWNGRTPKKRNWCLRTLKFSQPWVLFLDADERVSEEFTRELIDTLPATPHHGFWLRYQNVFLGRVLRHGDPMRKLALVRLRRGEFETIEEDQWSNLDMEVHEHPVVQGTLGEIRTPITHHDFKGLKYYLDRHNEYSSWEARRYKKLVGDGGANLGQLTTRQRIKYRLLRSWCLGPLYFAFSYVLKLGFLDGTPGFLFALFKMFYFIEIRAKIYEEEEAGLGGENAAQAVQSDLPHSGNRLAASGDRAPRVAA